MSKAVVIVPTYNEAENIAALLDAIVAKEPGLDILVVDDSSPDGTGEIVLQMQRKHPQVSLLSRSARSGLGAAYVAGFGWGLEHGYERLIQMDADFSHDPKYLAPMLSALDSADLVMGSRYIPGGGTEGWSLSRRLISQGGNIYARAILGMTQKDLTGGFNAWRRGTLEAIRYSSVNSVGYVFQVELKYRAFRAGKTLAEFPIVFPDRRLGVSKMSSSIVFEAARRVWLLRSQGQAHR